MIKYYVTKNGSLENIEEPIKDCWINMVHPTEKEISEITSLYHIEEDDLRAALDEEEASRLTREDDYTLVLVDIPSVEEKNGKKRFITLPMGIILAKDAIITICLETTPILNQAIKKKNADTKFRARFILQILLENAKQYLKNLRQISKQSEQLEAVLHKDIDNATLLEMMELGRSLLYFMTSLKGNNAVIEKLTKMPSITKYEEDEDLLEDLLVECRQATEMADTYSSVINGTMDGYASVISNNMSMVQKFLATASVIIAVPSIIFDAYGMNISANGGVPFITSKHAFFIIVAIAMIAMVIAQQYLKHKKNY